MLIWFSADKLQVNWQAIKLEPKSQGKEERRQEGQGASQGRAREKGAGEEARGKGTKGEVVTCISASLARTFTSNYIKKTQTKSQEPKVIDRKSEFKHS